MAISAETFRRRAVKQKSLHDVRKCLRRLFFDQHDTTILRNTYRAHISASSFEQHFPPYTMSGNTWRTTGKLSKPSCFSDRRTRETLEDPECFDFSNLEIVPHYFAVLSKDRNIHIIDFGDYGTGNCCPSVVRNPRAQLYDIGRRFERPY